MAHAFRFATKPLLRLTAGLCDHSELKTGHFIMFENLSTALQKTFRSLRGYGKLSEKNVKDALREVRLALLEADVNFKVARAKRPQLPNLTFRRPAWVRKCSTV